MNRLNIQQLKALAVIVNAGGVIAAGDFVIGRGKHTTRRAVPPFCAAMAILDAVRLPGASGAAAVKLAKSRPLVRKVIAVTRRRAASAAMNDLRLAVTKIKLPLPPLPPPLGGYTRYTYTDALPWDSLSDHSDCLGCHPTDGAASDECWVCGCDMQITGATKWIRVGGAPDGYLLPHSVPAGQLVMEVNTLGLYPIGSGCARKLPSAFTATTRTALPGLLK